ncbi:hypothetical protein [Methylobacterium sp. Leaf117]|uniref:hypothetical protein n=1 Tax=Methylobacterium sp. Leaf117 TaxID=1736260 RepID=UPI0006F435A2|nr:hypothetical protein [Methylobacterium sp. Leaf117]KQP90790.1 hypothetical protein ASF57_23575 [Methylobacterium sp. Leaf117]
MTETAKKRALYLRPGYLDATGLDDAVKAWLRTKDIEPVDDGSYELVVYLPYDGGGNYYHADVSPKMAAKLVAHIADGMETRQIHLRGTDTQWAGEVDRENDYKVLEEADLKWDDFGYGGKPTLAIMSMDEVEEAERQIRDEHQLECHDLGAVWQPPPPKPQHLPLRGLGPGAPGTVRVTWTAAVSIEEIAMMRRVADADPNRTGVCAPEKPDRTLEWLSGLGLFEKVPFEGRVAYRLTDRGRQVADEGRSAA